MDVVATLLSLPVTWVVSAGTVVYLVYWYETRPFNFFKKQGIPGPKPKLFFGNLWGLWNENIPKHDRAMMKTHGKVVGYFEGTLPNLWITDLDLIRTVMVKDFDYFVNQRDFGSSIKFIRKMVSSLKDQEWKDVRSSITPAFTPGKIKKMSSMIKECTDSLVLKLNTLASSEGKIDAKEEFRAFTIDVIARCVFRMKIDNLGGKDDPFLAKSRDVFNFPANKSPALLLTLMYPRLAAYLSDRYFFGESLTFFIQILEDLVKQRSNSNEKYHDFVEVTTDAIVEFTKRADGKTMPKWSNEDVEEIVVAQAVLFFLAGFDTTASTLTSASVVLARHPEIQDKLYQETMSRYEKFGEVSHEMILNFPYLDYVINEVLRMHPPATRTERVCGKDFTSNGVTFKKGMFVTVPLFALHYDEDYYPEPEKFNPDRWSPDNEVKPNQYAFLPFGVGPRNCVGMRFAMEEMKIALCQLIKNFRFFPVAETPEKIEYDDGFTFLLSPVRSTIGIEAR